MVVKHQDSQQIIRIFLTGPQKSSKPFRLLLLNLIWPDLGLTRLRTVSLLDVGLNWTLRNEASLGPYCQGFSSVCCYTLFGLDFSCQLLWCFLKDPVEQLGGRFEGETLHWKEVVGEFHKTTGRKTGGTERSNYNHCKLVCLVEGYILY